MEERLLLLAAILIGGFIYGFIDEIFRSPLKQSVLGDDGEWYDMRRYPTWKEVRRARARARRIAGRVQH
jgi:hypothetical protein